MTPKSLIRGFILFLLLSYSTPFLDNTNADDKSNADVIVKNTDDKSNADVIVKNADDKSKADVIVKNTDDKSNADVIVKEEGMNIYISPSLFGFFLEYPGLNAKLASGLDASDVEVSRSNGKYLFTSFLFAVEVKKTAVRNKKYELIFNYKIGVDEPLPIFAKGSGVATILLRDEKKDSLKADATLSLTSGGGLLGGVVKQFPKILEVVFSIKMEKAMGDAEKLAKFFNGSAGEIIDIVTDENSNFTRLELKELKVFFKRIKHK